MSLLGATLVVAGDDEYLRSRRIKEALDSLHAQIDDLSVARFAGDTLTPAEVAQGLAVDLFGGTPVMVVTDASKAPKNAMEALERWCAAKEPDAVLIVEVVTGGNAKAPKDTIALLKEAGANIAQVTAPKGKERLKFAATELRRVGLAADSDAERLLADCEPDLRGISIRAEQLAMDLDTGRGGRVRVSADQVAQVASSTGTANGFLVADALAARDPRALAGAIRTAAETGTASVLIVSACLGALRDIAAVQSGRPGKMPPWKAQKAQRNARKWRPEALAKAVTEIGGAHPSLGHSGRRDTDLAAALMRAISDR